MKANTPDYLIRLRNATRSLHSNAEIASDSERLLSDSPARSHYEKFLATHYIFHRHVASVSSFLRSEVHDTGLLDWPNCSRIDALKSDLDNLNFPTDKYSFPDASRQTHGFTLGLVYVTEGSCIGNQRVLSNLNRSDNFQQWNCSEFLKTCKIGFADRWKTLLSNMNTLATNPSLVDGSGYEDLERGAIDGFKLYIRYWNLVCEQTTTVSVATAK